MSLTDSYALARKALAVADALPGRKLGSTQRSVLEALLRHGNYPSSWVWSTHNQTVKILDTLVKRGLVERTEHPMTDYRGRRFPESHPYHRATRSSYRPAAFLTEDTDVSAPTPRAELLDEIAFYQGALARSERRLDDLRRAAYDAIRELRRWQGADAEQVDHAIDMAVRSLEQAL